jgi:adenosylcobinamide kinase / adenosylcobinamide-phosphate guanylyltransferase
VSLTFLLGGARSGKSARAIEFAREWSGPVTVIATGEPRDEEMVERIRLHRVARPDGWTTIEEPLDLGGAIERVSPETALIVDCLSLWVANRLEHGDAEATIEEEGEAAAMLAAARDALTIAVSNEVGLGIVPPTVLGRRYRDVLGRVNAAWAAAADQAALVVAGRTLPLQ